MSYFFTSILQALLPTALLLAFQWANYAKINTKIITRLSLLSLVLAMILGLNLSHNQNIQLILNSFYAVSLLFFFVIQFLHCSKLAYIGHFCLLLITALFWIRDPNMSAITATDVINTDFILNVAALLLGAITLIFIAILTRILLLQYQQHGHFLLLKTISVIVIIGILFAPLIGDIMLALIKLKLMPLSKGRLSYIAQSNYIIQYFNYLFSALFFVLLCLFSVKVILPRLRLVKQQINSIEKRKATAKYYQSRLTVCWGIVGFIFIVTTQLYWDKIASQPPRLSEAIPVELQADDTVRIAISEINNNKLHRFVWISDEGKAIRFLLLNRLDDRLSPVAVFDACILCGDEGYIMRDNQIVCVGCGVYIFKPSIGKPGGCNPVPIENWQQTDSEIIIPKKSLEEGLNYFTTIIRVETHDPVDGSKVINTEANFKYAYAGKTYFFMKEANFEVFREDPEKYIFKQGEK